jgi:peroxiredoxin
MTKLLAQLAFALSVPALAHAAAQVGGVAPDFALPSAADSKTTVALKPLLSKNKAVVVIFIATQCPFSNGYNDRMAKIAHDYAGKGVTVVGINANKTESAQEVAKHAGEHKFTFPVVKDEGSKVAGMYGAAHTPEAYVINAKGKLVYHGRIDERYDDPNAVKSPDLRNAIDAVLSGKPVPAPETKAFGCSIKN